MTTGGRPGTGNDVRVMRTPRSLDIAITGRCNLRCRYCSHFESAGDTADLPIEEWRAFFCELRACAVMDVCLSGGEPFIREDLPLLVEAIIASRMRFKILSNGTLITPELASLIAAGGHCDGIQISIDGSIPTTHDSFRGQGAFQQALRGVTCLLEKHLPATVRVTVHRRNVGELEAITKLLLEEIGLPSFSTNSAAYMGLCRKNAEEVVLSPAERTFAMEQLLDLSRRYPGRITALAGPLADGRTWLTMEKARREGRAPMAGRGVLSGCGGPFTKLAVRSDGVIVPCQQLSHLELGRINRDDLRQLWQEHPELLRLRGRNTIRLDSFPFCQGCPYVNYCTGNCPALAYTLCGKENHPSPDTCLRRFLADGGRLPMDMPEGGVSPECGPEGQ